MTDFFKDNLGYELADCFCGEKPELVPLRMTQYAGELFEVRCPKCGSNAGIFTSEEDAVFKWNMYMKRRPKE